MALVGAENTSELQEMAIVLRLAPVPQEDKAVMLNAIQVLIDHAPSSTLRYPMCDDQPAQIDCRITDCCYHNNQGACTNVSPAITMNPDGRFVCWSRNLREDV
jgi:hypothetical protein